LTGAQIHFVVRAPFEPYLGANAMNSPTPSPQKHDAVSIGKVFEIARKLHEAGKWPAAEQLYWRILALEPQHMASLFRLGSIRAKQGRIDEAIVLFRRVANATRHSAEIQSNVGFVLHGLNRPEEAISCYRTALALDGEHADTHNNLGNALNALGRSHEAVAHYHQALAMRPDYVDALSNLGNALHGLGRPAEAIPYYQKAIALQDEHADAHNNFGNSLYALGRLEEARLQFERALAIDPGSAPAYCNLGIVLKTQGQNEAAIANFHQAIAINPRYADAHRNLADLLQALKRDAEAIDHYQTALAVKPDYAQACNNLGNSLQKLGRFQEAVDYYRRAIALKPDYAHAHCNLGDVLLTLRRHEDAIKHFENAIAIDPSLAAAHHHLGIGLQTLGQLDDAARAYERAVELSPRQAQFHINLANARPFQAADPRLGAMETLLGDAGQSDDDRIVLHFALAKAFADLKQHERSFRHLLEGNALKRRQISYVEAETLDIFTRVQSVIGEALFADRRRGDPACEPVFVIGMARSGTTLIEQILASHSKVYGAGELEDFGHAVSNFAQSKGASEGILELLPSLSADDLRQIGADYLARIRPDAGGAERIVNKMPSNFVFAGLIHLALPNARIIHARRHPLDTCFSCFSLLFSGNQPYAYDLGELGRYYRAYERLMTHWRSVLPEAVMIEVNYEDLVGDLQTHARRIIAHCGLDWEDACLSFHKTQRPVRTASSAQVRQPLYRSSIGRWRPYRQQLSPLIAALELDTTSDAAASPT
jgi:tetratricopeptide (TPR) repeat protein